MKVLKKSCDDLLNIELELKKIIKFLRDEILDLKRNNKILKTQKTKSINKLEEKINSLTSQNKASIRQLTWLLKKYNSINKFFKSNPSNAEYYKNLSDEKYELGEYENAIKNLNKAIKINPNNAEYYDNRGWCFYLLEDYQNAIKDYTKAIEINPNDAKYYNWKGNSFHALKDYQNAIKNFSRAIEIYPNYATSYSNRGWCFYLLDDSQNAIKDYTKSIEINPNGYYDSNDRSCYQFGEYKSDLIAEDIELRKLQKTSINLQDIFEKTGDSNDLDRYINARKEFRTKFRELYSIDVNDQKQIKPIWKNDLSKLTTLTKAIEIQPTEQNYHMLGHSQQKLGYFEKSIESFQKAIELNPKNEDYKKSLDDLLTINSDNSIKGDLTLKKVNYTSSINENTSTFPIFKTPKKGCVIKTHKYGKNQRRGYKENSFQNAIETYFSNEYKISGNTVLTTGEHTKPFEPDIAIIGINNNIRIDIEIDEPYAGITRQATHCKGDDDNRDSYFTDRGWIVIRFSEYQVHTNEKECLKYIASVINSIDTSFVIPLNLKNVNTIEKKKLWDLLLAQKWEKSNFRERYLDHDFGIQPNIVSQFETIELTKEEKERELAEENEVNTTTYEDEDNIEPLKFNNTNRVFRDNRLKFYPKEHKYTIDNKPVPSVSTIIKKFFNEFDKKKVAENLKPSNRLHGLSVPKIIEIWDEKGRISREKGTSLHQQIENYYLGKTYTNTDVFYQFLNFVNDHENLNIYRTEWRIFDEKYDVAGTIDLLVKNDNGTYDIYDWKRSKNVVDSDGDIDYDNWGKFGIGKLSKIEDTSYNQYSLQQNLYRHILETKYNIPIENMYLIVMHDDDGFDNYTKVPVERMNTEIQYILNTL